MPFEVGTKDCTALSDAELAEMADLCVDRAPGFDIGFLSKQCEEWVLVSLGEGIDDPGDARKRRRPFAGKWRRRRAAARSKSGEMAGKRARFCTSTSVWKACAA